jgi:hypothetical protein
VRLIHGTWFTSVDAAQNVTVTATTQPNNGGTWANLVWQNTVAHAGQTADVQRSPLGPKTVSASLDNTKSVNLHFVRIASLVCENGIVTANPTTWKLYAYAGAPDAKVLATPDPDRYRYRNEFEWRWNAGNAGASERRRLVPVGAVAADIAVTPILFEDAHLTITLHICLAPILQIEHLAFAGGRPIDCDTLGNFDDAWEVGRAQPDPTAGAVVVAPQPNSPLCYTRNTSIQITARFTVARAPTDNGEIVRVKGTANVGGRTLKWEDNNVVVNQADATVTTAAMNSSATLPNKANFYPGVDIHWETIGPDGQTRDAGHTLHDIYATLANPAGGVANYWTLLHISCVAANGATGESAVISRTFAAFALATGVVRRRDTTQMSYWVPNNTTAGSSFGILQRPDGGGQCGAWAHLFVDMLQVHGITRIRFRQIEHATAGWGFLVKNWTFQHPPASSLTAFTHYLWDISVNGALLGAAPFVQAAACVTRPPNGLPGQNNADPPPAFLNHFVAEDTVNHKVYDPSYAAGPYADFRRWEAAAIAGLFDNTSQAGYDKSLPGGAAVRRLVDN